MDSKKIGPTFAQEIALAGLSGLPFSWGADGSFTYSDSITGEQKSAIESVYAAHDPSKKMEIQN